MNVLPDIVITDSGRCEIIIKENGYAVGGFTIPASWYDEDFYEFFGFDPPPTIRHIDIKAKFTIGSE